VYQIYISAHRLLIVCILTFQTYQCHNKVTSDFVFLGSCSMIATAGHSSESKNVALWDSLLPQKKALITGTYFLLCSHYVMFSYGVSHIGLLCSHYPKFYKHCMILGFHCGVLLGCYAAYIGSCQCFTTTYWSHHRGQWCPRGGGVQTPPRNS